jgi:hypothetical protein
MKKVRVFLFAALALALAVGVSGQAQAGDIKVSQGGAVVAYDHWLPTANPNATGALLAGPVAWTDGAVNPPCFAPSAPCTGDPAGGVNMGSPIGYLPISGTSATNCSNVKKQKDCGIIVAFVETTTAAGTGTAVATLKQGTKVVGTSKTTLSTALVANTIYAIQIAAPKLKATAKAGAVTLSIKTTIGTDTATGTTTIGAM